MQRRRGSLARASVSAFATADIVEYHPSMSLEAPAGHAAQLLAPTQPAAAVAAMTATPSTQRAEDATLASVLAVRAALWTRVDALRDALAAHDATAYARECEALRQLQQLHFLLNILFPSTFPPCCSSPVLLASLLDYLLFVCGSQQRESHVRTLQLAAYQHLARSAASTPPTNS